MSTKAAVARRSQVEVHRKKDGLLVINGLRESRYMTFWERVRYTLWGALPYV